MLPCVYVVQRLAAQPVHDLAQQFEIDIAIDETRRRRRRRLIDQRAMDAGFVAGPRRLQLQIRTAARKNASSDREW